MSLKKGGTCEGFFEPACPAQPSSSQPGNWDECKDGNDAQNEEQGCQSRLIFFSRAKV